MKHSSGPAADVAFLKKWPLVIAFGALLAVSGCDSSGDVEDATEISLGDLAECESAGELPSLTVDPEVLRVGIQPNAIVIDDGDVFMVSSGDNTVASWRSSDPGSLRADFVDLGPDQSPYDIAVDDDALFVTHFLGQAVSKWSRGSGEELARVNHPELVSPQDIVVSGNRVFVAATGFVLPLPSTRFGELVVLESETLDLVAVVPTSWSNPQFVLVDEALDLVVVVSSGATEFDPVSGLVRPIEPGGVDLFELSTLSSASTPTASVELGLDALVGNPGQPAVIGETLYLGSGTGPVLFAVNLVTGETLFDADNPLSLPAGEGNSLMRPYAGPNGLLWILDFNGDRLWMMDPSCHQIVNPPVDVGRSSEMLEGPTDLAFERSGTAWIVMSLSGAIAQISE